MFFEYDGGFTFINSWGKYGGPNAYKGFKEPTDLSIDINDNVYITDRGNNVVKKYTKSGSWIKTYSHNDFLNATSTAIDDDRNLHVLNANNTVVKLKQDGTYITTYSINTTSTPKRIKNSKNGFLYALFNDRVIKLTKGGAYSGTFADTFSDVTYNSLYHDDNQNLYITNTNSILRYFDEVTIDSAIKTISVLGWDMEDIYIDLDEYVQDWVYNRSFAKMYDNIDLVRRSLIGSIYQTTDNQGKIKNVIRGFTPAQYTALFDSTPKADIYVGSNEIVSNSVINRCIYQLYEIQALILASVTGNL